MSVTFGPKLGLIINALTGDAHDVALRAFLRAYDQCQFLSVINQVTTAPPGSPANGDAYIVATGGSGAWAGHDNSVAVWTTDNPASPGGVWEFHVPKAGWFGYSVADAGFFGFTGSAWAAIGGGGGGGAPALVAQHMWVANAATVGPYYAIPLALGFQPVDSINNAGVLSNRLPVANGEPVSWKLTTSATAASFHELGESVAALLLTSLGLFQTVVALGQTTACRFWAGLCQDGGVGSIFQSDAPSGEALVMFRYSTAAGDVNFQCVTQTGVGVTATVVDSGVPADTAFHTFKITFVSGSAKFYIDGALVATISTTISSSTSYKYCTQVHIDNVGAAADKNIAAAYIAWTGAL